MRVLFALLVLAIGCGSVTPTPARAWDTKAADALFEQREDPKKLESAIQQYEDLGAYGRAAMACLLRMEDHDDLKADDAKAPWIERGLKDAAKALGADDADAVHDRLDKLAKKDAEALFAFAALYGRKIEISWKAKQAFMVKKFARAAERAAALDATVFHGGPWRMLAEFHATAPGFMGGDAAKAKAEAQAAVDVDPKFLQNYVSRAVVEREAGDAAASKADLERAASGDVAAVADAVPEQKAAQRDAKRELEGKK